MKEFLLVFRRDNKTKELQPTTAQMLLHLRHWRKWYISLAEEGKLARPLMRCDPNGVVLRKGSLVTVGSYTDGNDSMRGMIIIRAFDYDQAVAIAEKAPVLELGGTVEVRMAI